MITRVISIFKRKEIHFQNMRLSPEQRYALQCLQEGQNTFITGPGGTGKTLLIEHMYKWANQHNKKIQVCALTGCASILLSHCNAKTIHSWSGIRLGKGNKQQTLMSVLRNRKAVSAWKTTQILIVDEVSMMSKSMFETLDYIGKNVRKRYDKIFGGMQIVFTGDFYQLPPVGNDAETQAFCFESPIWNTAFPIDNHIELVTIFRQKDQIFQSILMNVREGKITESQIKILNKHVHREYNPVEHNGCIPTKIFPTKSRVEQYNQYMFDQINEASYTYDYVVKTNCSTYLDGSNRTISAEDYTTGLSLPKTEIQRIVESLKTNLNCPSPLNLKKGASVMCTFNVDLESGVCNGSIGVIIEFRTNPTSAIPIPVVKFSNGYIREMPIQYWHSEEFPTIAIGQLPLCLAWAITIHKIQGATLTMAEMDIGQSIFEYGQTYVALSRVQDLDGLYLTDFSAKKIKANPKVIAFYNSIPKVIYEDEIPEEEEDSIEELDLEDEIPSSISSKEESNTTESNNVAEPSASSSDMPSSSTTKTIHFHQFAYTENLSNIRKDTSTIQENPLETNSKMCCICLENEKCVLLLPCKHICICTKCSKKSLKCCPMCRETILQKLKVYL